MSPFIVWLGASVGAAIIVAKMGIFAWLRRALPKPQGRSPFFASLVRCPPCLAFWFGAAFWLLDRNWYNGEPAFAFRSAMDLIPLFLHGCAASAATWLYYLVTLKLGAVEVLANERHPFADEAPAAREAVRAALRAHVNEANIHSAAFETALDALADAPVKVRK